MLEETIRGLEIVDEFNFNIIEDPEIKKKALSGKDYVKFVGKKVSLPLIPPTLSQNILFTGGIGSGKTNGICELVDQLLDKLV